MNPRPATGPAAPAIDHEVTCAGAHHAHEQLLLDTRAAPAASP